MSWKELSDGLSFKRTKKKVVVWRSPCEKCRYWNERRGHLCKPCRDAGITYEDHKEVVWE